MFYVVGDEQKHVYVYDSDDGSCEVIPKSKLHCISYDTKRDINIPLYKLCMLAEVPNFDRCCHLTLLEKNMFSLILTIVRSEFIRGDERNLFISRARNWGYDESYCVFLSSEGLYSANVDMYEVGIDYSDRINICLEYSIMIPPVMFLYLVKLFKSYNLDALLSAVDCIIFQVDEMKSWDFGNGKWRV